MASIASAGPATAARLNSPQARARRQRQRRREAVIEALLLGAAAVSVLVTAAIVAVLLIESALFFSEVSIWKFITGTVWTPLFADPEYGILPLVVGTLVSSAVALTVALPLGLVIAIYLSEFADPRVRETLKPFLELLSGIPTVVYGYFALLFVSPLLRATVLPDLPGFNVLAAGIVMGIMIIPYISSLSEDAMRAVPNALREASLAIGATRFQTAIKVVLPAAFSGLAAAAILAISRAVGETMIVAIAAGQQPNLTIDPTEPAATITAYIAQVALGDLPHGSIQYQSIFAAGLTLMLMTLGFNLIGHWLRQRYREAY
ncbi:MAG: phosphate ABC transporter permease subunit PstC [Alphaproteobacteria bacterium]|nr:phosphate ABC transporter permease subunit PstC [Alphaproteobacteria bacterium]